MKVSRGKFKGRSITSGKNKHLRPTKSIVKEAVINILGKSLDGAHFLDLFAGSGAVGIDALSCGAERVVFVDRQVDLIHKNLEKLTGDVSVVRMDALRFLKMTKERFTIIYIDPPWKNTDAYTSALKAILNFDILDSNGYVIIEMYRKNIIEPMPELTQMQTHYYGDTSLVFFKQ